MSRKPELQYDIETLKVKGYNSAVQRIVELDLLSDKLIIKKEINKLSPKSKGLVPNSAFNAIISAYNEVKDEIMQSPSVI